MAKAKKKIKANIYGKKSKKESRRVRDNDKDGM